MDGNKMNGLLQRQNLRASQKPFAAMEMARMECRIPLQATVECVHASSLSPTLMSECASCFFFPSFTEHTRYNKLKMARFLALPRSPTISGCCKSRQQPAAHLSWASSDA